MIMRKFLDERFIWLAIVLLLVLTYIIDSRSIDVMFPLSLFVIPHCIFLGFTALIYKYLFNRIDSINKILSVIVKIGFSILMILTWNGIFYLFFELILGIELRDVFHLKPLYMRNFLYYSQGVVLLILFIDVLIRIYGSEES